MAKFNTAAEAQQAAVALMAAGKITAWTDYRQFGKFVVRIQIGGQWFNMRARDVA